VRWQSQDPTTLLNQPVDRIEYIDKVDTGALIDEGPRNDTLIIRNNADKCILRLEGVDAGIEEHVETISQLARLVPVPTEVDLALASRWEISINTHQENVDEDWSNA
jgi:hypothetical protein